MTMKCVNGIDDVDRLRATRDLIEADADGPLSNSRYESTIVWDKAYHTKSRVTDGQEVIGDEPEQYGGRGVGITPEDMLLTAVGNCLAGITNEDDRPVAQGVHEFPEAPRLYVIGHFVPLSGYLREIRLDAGRIARKIGKQLATQGVPSRANLHQSMHIVEE